MGGSRERRGSNRPTRHVFASLALFVPLLAPAPPAQAADGPLAVERKIPLGAIRGRLDHLAIDLDRRRLFVAELGHDSLGIVDLAAATVMRRIPNLGEPQGVAYLRSLDVVIVASGDTGNVSLLRGADFAPMGTIRLGSDADNVRLGASDGLVYVGYGSGAIAVVDPQRMAKLRDIVLPGHPEGFQLDLRSDRIFVNVPRARQILVADRVSGRTLAVWPTPSWSANFPMAIDPPAGEVVAAFRNPARLVSFAMRDGGVRSVVKTCGDADDVFIDDRRKRTYVVCGEGYVDAFQTGSTGREPIGRLKTVYGTRTGLFVPELDRLFIAVRKRLREPAAIWVLRPSEGTR